MAGNRKHHDAATRARAFELYVRQGIEMEDIARDLSVPIGTLKRWASDGRESPDQKTWSQLRSKSFRDRSALAARFHDLTAQAFDKAEKSKDPQDLYAAMKMFATIQAEADPTRREADREKALLDKEKAQAERERMKAAAAKAGKEIEKIAGRALTKEELGRIAEQFYGVSLNG